MEVFSAGLCFALTESRSCTVKSILGGSPELRTTSRIVLYLVEGHVVAVDDVLGSVLLQV